MVESICGPPIRALPRSSSEYDTKSGRRPCFHGQCHLRSDSSMRSRSEVSLRAKTQQALPTNSSSVSIGRGSSILGPSLSAQVRMHFIRSF
jgi:hypothetical protein